MKIINVHEYHAYDKNNLSRRRPLSYRNQSIDLRSPLICGANQWTGFYMITASVLKGLTLSMWMGEPFHNKSSAIVSSENVWTKNNVQMRNIL